MPSASPSPAAHAETTPRTSARGDPTGSAPPGSASLVPSPRRPRCALGQGAATGRGPAGVCSCRLPHPVRLCLLGAEALGGQAGGLPLRPAADELGRGQVSAALVVAGGLAVAAPSSPLVRDEVGGVGAADARF